MKLDLNTPNAAVPSPVVVPAPAARVYPLSGNPERVAWLVLFGAFGVCILLAVSVPLLTLQFIRFATEAQSGSLQAVGLTQEGVTPVRVSLPNVALPIAVQDPMPVAEGSSISTDPTDTSRAFLTFFDSSTATIHPNSQLLLQEMRRPRFAWSERPNTITVEQPRGIVRYAIAPPWPHPGNPDGRAVQFVVRTLHFDAWLNPGSYSIEVTENSSQVIVREGSALVRAKDNSRQVLVGQGQRVVAESGQALADPLPAAQNLIVNGDFSGDINCDPNQSREWKCYVDQGGDEGNVNGSISVVTLDNRRAVRILRTNSGQNSAITGIRQILDKDVSDYRSLKLSADVRLANQSLSGGGYQSTEYPLILRLKYRDVDGNEWDWVRGFYYQNTANNPTRNGEGIPRNIWIPYETSNLLELLNPKPFRLLYLEIYASGWDYESYISSVRLHAE